MLEYDFILGMWIPDDWFDDDEEDKKVEENQKEKRYER